MGIELGEIKVSKICSDKKLGTFWAIASKKEWMELRVTKSGRIKPFTVHKKRHPVFSFDK